MIRVGTDCSGIEAPIQALIQLKIPFKHIFSSDIDKYCIQSIKANYNPEIIFGDKDGPYPDGDITKRDINQVPDIDLYVCGFPCQPFSMAGGRKGFNDKRGNVFFSCLEVIKEKQPKVFILENVKGLLSHDKGNTFKIVMNELNKLKDYNVDWKVLNTKDYGIPQNTERMFIVGVKNNKDFFYTWPKTKKLKLLSNFIDWNDTKYFDTKRIKCIIPKNSLFIELNFQRNSFLQTHLICPCLNTGSGLWCVPLHRYANITEHLMLQGFPKNFKQVVSDTQFKKQIGNSMSINVILEILKLNKNYFCL
jgi:DNA (cytosine-5)-methyltransferase 1